jgi:Arc/MetJ family transcription regulator
MGTNIDIDDELLSQTMTATGLPTKRATVEAGLRLLVRVHRQVAAIASRDWAGKAIWTRCGSAARDPA